MGTYSFKPAGTKGLRMSVTKGVEGFEYHGKIIKYIDEKGKDPGFYRWRLDLYYEPHRAKTKFLHNELTYEIYLAKHRQLCFSSYDEFKKEHR